MAQLQTRFARWLAGGALASTLLLSGCADGVDLNGKVFDWMGISPAAQEARRFEPKIADRAPLVVPPDVNRLPEPGSEAAPGAHMAWPDDPEQRKVREAQERERLHLAYCRGDVEWKERALKKVEGAPRSPYGPCPSIIGNMTTNIDINKQ
jgi:hypothetical protein